MKRFLMVILAAVMLSAAFTSCSDPLKDAYKNTTSATSATKSTTEQRAYENNFDGLKTYMVDKGYISSKDKGTSMNAKLIGATKGNLYVNGKVNIEIYEFKTNGLNNKAQDTINSVKEKGYYTIYDTKIEATLTADNKFMMIYYTAETSQDSIDAKKNAIKDFQRFNK